MKILSARGLWPWPWRLRVLVGLALTVASLQVVAQAPGHIDSDVEVRIRAAVDAVRMVDTHEHLPSEEELRRDAAHADFGSLFEAYQIQDMISAGMPRTLASRIGAPDVPVEEKWRLMKDYWPLIKTTGYGQTVSIAARDLYGIDDINESTVQELSRRVREMRAGPLFEEILRKRAKIDISLVYRTFEPRAETAEERRYVRRLFGLR